MEEREAFLIGAGPAAAFGGEAEGGHDGGAALFDLAAGIDPAGKRREAIGAEFDEAARKRLGNGGAAEKLLGEDRSGDARLAEIDGWLSGAHGLPMW